MYHRESPITPSQQATNGALEIFVAACDANDVRRQLFGLAVLRDATEPQLDVAMAVVGARRQMSRAGLEALFAR